MRISSNKQADACIVLFLGCISHHDAAAYQMETSLFVMGLLRYLSL